MSAGSVSAFTRDPSTAHRKACPQRAAGLTLIELVVFIVIVSVGIVGILSVMNVTTRAGSDPLIAKQAFAIAEALLEEVQQAPFTFCDPDDANFATAASPGACASLPEGIGPEAGDARPYDNASDYHGLVLASLSDVAGIPVPGLPGYSAVISVAPADLGSGTGSPITAASRDALLITVAVNGPANTTVTLEGYRARYAPNSGP